MTEGQEAALELYEDMIAADKAAISGAEAADEAPETKAATGRIWPNRIETNDSKSFPISRGYRIRCGSLFWVDPFTFD